MMRCLEAHGTVYHAVQFVRARPSVTLSSEFCLQAVSTPAGLASLLLPPAPPSASGPAPEAARGPPSVWWIYHALALFEKALRRAAPHHPAAPPHGELASSALACSGLHELLPPLASCGC